MAWTHGTIDHGATVVHTDTDDIHITGKIDGGSSATLTSTSGSIIIDGKVDGGSNATLIAKKVIRIGFAGSDDGEKKIDGGSSVDAHAGEDISIGNKIDNNSHVTLISDLGSITIGGKIDHDSVVRLTAAGNIRIGEAGNNGGERKIDGNSNVQAHAGGSIHLFNKIDGGSLSGKHSVVEFQACRGITIDDKIDGGSEVNLAVSDGTNMTGLPPTINIGDKIGGGGTTVNYWPANSLHVANAIEGTVNLVSWADLSYCGSGPEGYYWRNWSQTFGYVAEKRFYPRTVDDLSMILEEVRREGIPVKAVGGGWSFSDASLPMKNQQDVDAVSIQKRGEDGAEDFSHVLQGLNGVTNSLVDLQPENVSGDLPLFSHYDQPSLSEMTDSGANLPFAKRVAFINTRGLASSLQDLLYSIMSDEARASVSPVERRPRPRKHYFYVEAGITIEDLDQLLDHQKPRLAIQASGGSVGATLAGALSTATHGAEFTFPLLVDQVRAILLVGPGGQQWWIEGDTSIADQSRLQTVYPQIDPQHFISKSTPLGKIGAQDVLNAVIVSMGTMGVFYSVVLEVVPQFGLQQISKAFPNDGASTGWSRVLAGANTSESALRSGDPTANIAVLDFLLDGSANGTTIPKNNNVFCDLAINPLNSDCWITNRRVTPDIPIDANRPPPDFQDAFTEALTPHAVDDVTKSKLLGRIFDFLGWATDVPGNVVDAKNDFEQGLRLASFVMSYPDPLVSAAATANVQAVANETNSGHADRGQQFLADALSGFLNAVQGTVYGVLGDTTDVSHKIWSVGWPADGIPGRGIEIALPQDKAFTFLQSVLFDNVFAKTMVKGNKPLIGYVSVRVCPPTKTLMGMQQFAPYSIMIEVVGYRSPEANAVMDLIQQSALDRNVRALDAMLHWGLENDQMTDLDLARMPVARTPLVTNSSFTRLSGFKQVRQSLIDGHTPSPFENNFVHRLKL